MAFYDLLPDKRRQLVTEIYERLSLSISTCNLTYINKIFADEDTYIRKAGYLAVGKMYMAKEIARADIIHALEKSWLSTHHHIRQTVINAAGEIGKYDFDIVARFFDRGLFDTHHTVRNAVIGSVKKMGEKNPVPVLSWARQYLHHADKEIRREICHGIELRGRKYPQDILPMLRELEHDATARVRNTLVHVLGQISYKKGCLETVITDLQKWENQDIAGKAIAEIIDVHHRYRNFSFYTQEQAIQIIQNLNSVPYRI